ncbi:DUF4275 family protein [Pyxidicoccus fallax]|uniref:DUF4275 family protein n=1 Tax=Pyxidicoccus fallax TaxID=394095 RepID=A0A848LQG4_9BACT|nr:DUF4275 family protein [Pyxidicoccus fallax]NMO20006.1 DUF4275 family protein [Pyxidicoccus fallax]NPC80881.1 DUF4275 family protein [Pyxidicoccus fallax]
MNVMDFVSALSRCGTFTEVPRRERWRWMQEWRGVYASALHEATGEWKHGRHDWHVFSFGYTHGLSGSKARHAYSLERPGSLLVIPESEALPAGRLDANLLPDLFSLNQDVHVFPPDLSWTMSFTHEMSAGIGPYFCRRETSMPQD